MKSFLSKIYAYRFFDDFVLIYPLYMVMFTDYQMEPWQLAVLLATWSATSFLLEIPSGVWADRYDRKNILFIGQLLRAFGYACWLLFPGFWGFLVGFVCWGIKSAFTSGTFQALIYDELKYYKKEGAFTKILGRTETIAFIAILAASFLASPVILLGYNAVLMLSILALVLSSMMVLAIPKVQPVASTPQKPYFSLLREGLHKTFRHPPIFHFLIFLSLVIALGGALDEFWTVFADQAGLPKYGLGLFLGAMSGVQAIASFIAYRFEKYPNSFFYFLFLATGLMLFGAAYLFSIPALLLLVLFSFSFTIIQIVYEGRLHHVIDSPMRATISSFSGFLTEIGSLLVYFSFAFLAQSYNYRTAFLTYGLIVAIVGVGYLVLGKRF